MENFAREMSVDELIDIVLCGDVLSRPLERRYDGDDTPIRELMEWLKIPDTLAHMLLIVSEVNRECVARGIHVPRGN